MLFFAEKCRQAQSLKAQKKACPFCKEQKKRPLTNYMRKRESRKHHDSICEEHEEENQEEAEEEEEVQLAAMRPANPSMEQYSNSQHSSANKPNFNSN